jgi:hypothetical protein
MSSAQHTPFYKHPHYQHRQQHRHRHQQQQQGFLRQTQLQPLMLPYWL